MWKDRDLFHLPYFENVYRSVSAFQVTECVDLTIEVEGERFISGTSQKIKTDEITANFDTIKYLHVARVVLREFGQTINVSTSYDPTAYAILELYLNLIVGHKIVTPATSLTSYTVTLEAAQDIDVFDISALERGILLTSPSQLVLEGQTINVPPLATVVCNMKAREGQKLSGIRAGESFDIVLDVTPESYIIVDFVSAFNLNNQPQPHSIPPQTKK